MLHLITVTRFSFTTSRTEDPAASVNNSTFFNPLLFYNLVYFNALYLRSAIRQQNKNAGGISIYGKKTEEGNSGGRRLSALFCDAVMQGG